MSLGRRRTRRSGGAGAFSLFSFQDIMAAVTGVMIVTTLLLIIELLTRTVTAQPSASAVEPSSTVSAERLAYRDALRDQLGERFRTDVPAAASVIRAEALAAELLQQQLDASRQEQAEQSKRLDSLAELEQRHAEETEQLAAELAEAEHQLAAARNRQRVTRLVGPSDGRTTWWVRLGAEAITSGVLDDPAYDREPVRHRTPRTLRSWAEDKDPATTAFVLLVEPAGVEAFTGLQAELRRAGFAVGWDIVLPNSAADGVEATP